MHSKSPSQGLACLQHLSNSLPHGSQRGGNLPLPSTSRPASHGAPSAQQTLSFPHSPWNLHSQVRPPLTSHTKSSWNPVPYFENAVGFQSWLQKTSEAWKLILRSSAHNIVMTDDCNSPRYGCMPCMCSHGAAYNHFSRNGSAAASLKALQVALLPRWVQILRRGEQFVVTYVVQVPNGKYGTSELHRGRLRCQPAGLCSDSSRWCRYASKLLGFVICFCSCCLTVEGQEM
jgi:hypothetical protein